MPRINNRVRRKRSEPLETLLDFSLTRVGSIHSTYTIAKQRVSRDEESLIFVVETD